MTTKGLLVVISGFSGVGKGTLVKRMMEKYDNYALSVSATTRAPRPGEIQGKEYFFLTKPEFEEMIRKDELIEYACYCDRYYGTPKKYIEEQLNKGKDIILEIEIQGARNIRKMFPGAVLLFVMPPSVDTLFERLKGRGSESVEEITARLNRAVEESEGVEEYDYIVINDDLEQCVEQTHSMIQCQHLRTEHNLERIETLRNDIRKYSKGE